MGDIRPLIENIHNTFAQKDDNKVYELVYLILKQKFESGDKAEQEIFVKRLTIIQDILIRKFNKDTISKVVDRLIKNEKWHCKILISLILLLIKHNTSASTGQSTAAGVNAHD